MRPVRSSIVTSTRFLSRLPTPRPVLSTWQLSHIRLSSTQTATSSPPSLRRNAFISLTLLTSASLLYYFDPFTSRSYSGTTETATPNGVPVTTKSQKYDKTFNVAIRTRRGVQEETFVRKSEGEIDAALHEHETSSGGGGVGAGAARWDNSWLGSNEPCEDRWAVNVIPGQQRSGARGDLMLFSIFDGHAGDATSTLLAKTLHPTVALGLAGVQAGIVPRLPGDTEGWGEWTKRWLGLSSSAWTVEHVQKSLQTSFLTLDENICQTPIRLLSSVRRAPSPQPTANNSDPSPAKLFAAMSEPALSGACAITAVIDSANQGLYVANTGDCRAVAGWVDAEGRWRCDVLSEDQMGENEKEVERIRSEHPASERDMVIRGGRIQGGLQPTRAFGDAVYKWTMQQYQAISEVVRSEGGKVRPQRPDSYTPPYVTAKPEVAYRPIQGREGETLKFLILATDGLWDRLTSEESVLLLASYLAHPSHPDIPKSHLPQAFPLLPPPSPASRPYPAQPLPGSPERANGTWVFEGDRNAATHLIRNSLAGGDRKLRGELVSMKGDMTRWMRDDITVTVVLF